jgi:hypothetical protein
LDDASRNTGLGNLGLKNIEVVMSSGKSIGGTMVLILFGVIAFFGGAKWLVALIPAAMLVWYGTGSAWRRGRN